MFVLGLMYKYECVTFRDNVCLFLSSPNFRVENVCVVCMYLYVLILRVRFQIYVMNVVTFQNIEVVLISNQIVILCNYIVYINLDQLEFLLSIQWFKGGITNICYNCLDKNIESGHGEKIALHWEGNESGLDDSLTYNQLLDRVYQVHYFFFLYWLLD